MPEGIDRKFMEMQRWCVQNAFYGVPKYLKFVL
jgi:hypothetical protein